MRFYIKLTVWYVLYKHTWIILNEYKILKFIQKYKMLNQCILLIPTVHLVDTIRLALTYYDIWYKLLWTLIRNKKILWNSSEYHYRGNFQTDKRSFTLLFLECSSGVSVALDEQREGWDPLLLPPRPPLPIPSFPPEVVFETPVPPPPLLDPEFPFPRLPPAETLAEVSILLVLAHRGKQSAPEVEKSF